MTSLILAISIIWNINQPVTLDCVYVSGVNLQKQTAKIEVDENSRVQSVEFKDCHPFVGSYHAPNKELFLFDVNANGGVIYKYNPATRVIGNL